MRPLSLGLRLAVLVRAKLSTFGFGGPTEVTCGGNALKFYASVRLNIRRVGFIKKGEEGSSDNIFLAWILVVYCFANKVTDMQQAKTLAGDGLGEARSGDCRLLDNRNSKIIELAVKHKFIKKNGAFYDCNGRKYHGKEALREFLAHNDDVQEELVMKLREKLLEAETDQELKDETTDGEPTQETIPLDSTDDEAVAAAEASM
ncbi:hypothetical protein OIU85_013219 [Salix viminalis]|uniref:RecA family profile 2 domain-containing protein n=1 Tax=Salix viminalis TaxID=40686 RepID=A0A9Q0NR08_SALVM|nr:hypothetical protein OIU85_013219 [Salix viminalis]